MRFNELLKQSDKILLSSPYLVNDFDIFLTEETTDCLKKIQLITTLHPKSLDQINKIESLISLIQLPRIKNGDWDCIISLNNKLHGKVYIFGKKEEYFSAIITSANFTYNGLVLNHEWGVEITDKYIINEIANDLINSIDPDFKEVSFSHIFYLKKRVDSFINKNENKQVEEIDLDLTSLLKEKQIESKKELQEENSTSNKKTNEFEITDEYLASWETYFNEFLEFKKKTNKLTVPKDYQPYGLYKWYRMQKVFYSNEKIPLEHKEKLEKVGFYFGDGHELRWAKIWEENYRLLEAYYEEYDTSDVPHITDNKDAFYSLGNWVALQKTYFNNDILSDYKIERLNDLDFIWKKEYEYKFKYSPNKDKFFARLEELKKWKEKYGDCHVPQINPDKTQNSLGRWLNSQRVLKRKGKKDSKGIIRHLDEEKEFLLLEIGVDFDYEENKHKNSFEKQVQSFLSFRYQYPDLKAPSNKFKKEKDNLAQWKHKFDKLPKYKQLKLKELKIIE